MNHEHWNRLAHRFEDAVCDIAATDLGQVLRRLVNMIESHHRRRVLVDLGCGIGTFILRFGSRFSDVIGVDYSSRMLARARERCAALDRVRWLCVDMRHAARVIGACADLTVCLNVITSPSAAHRHAHWSSVTAVSRPGGFVLIVVPSIESGSMVAALYGGKPSGLAREGILNGELIRSGKDVQKYYSYGELHATVTRQGLTVRAIRRVFYPWTAEGLLEPLNKDLRPWDWGCLARRPEVGGLTGACSRRATGAPLDGGRRRARG